MACLEAQKKAHQKMARRFSRSRIVWRTKSELLAMVTQKGGPKARGAGNQHDKPQLQKSQWRDLRSPAKGCFLTFSGLNTENPLVGK